MKIKNFKHYETEYIHELEKQIPMSLHTHVDTSLINTFFSFNLGSLIKNKIIVDIGSGAGRMIPLFSCLEPISILSVEPETKGIEVQKKFLKQNFYFLPHKQVKNVYFYNMSAINFFNQDVDFDTIMMFDMIYLIENDLDFIFSKYNNKNIVIDSKIGHFKSINNVIEKYFDIDYKVNYVHGINKKMLITLKPKQ